METRMSTMVHSPSFLFSIRSLTRVKGQISPFSLSQHRLFPSVTMLQHYQILCLQRAVSSEHRLSLAYPESLTNFSSAQANSSPREYTKGLIRVMASMHQQL